MHLSWYPVVSKTVLVLGDESDWDSYTKFFRELHRHHSKKTNWVTALYDNLEKNRMPAINSDTIIIYLFFPFKYWNKNIEYREYKGVYGNREFYHKFRDFWSDINRNLNNLYPNKNLYFINHPLRIAVDRDKELTKTMLSEAGIEVPQSFYTRDYKDILKIVNEENKKLFLKVRYGSMGKGITYMEKGRWVTNFRFKNNRIVSRHADHGWSFTDITNNSDFLKKLLTKDIIIEEAIDRYIIKERVFDLRIYVCFNEVLYIYPRTNKKDAVSTNISQGGAGETQTFLKKIPENILKKSCRNALKAAKTVGVNTAGVDVIISKDLKHAYVVELNAFPGFPSTKRFNLSRRIIKKIEKKKWE